MGRIFSTISFSWGRGAGHFWANFEGVGREEVGGNYLRCLLIVKFVGLGEQRGRETGNISESSYGGGNMNKQTFFGGTIPTI